MEMWKKCSQLVSMIKLYIKQLYSKKKILNRLSFSLIALHVILCFSTIFPQYYNFFHIWKYLFL